MDAVKLEVAEAVGAAAAGLRLMSPGVKGTSCMSSSSPPPSGAGKLFAAAALSETLLAVPPKS